MKKIILILIAGCFLAACKKESPLLYSEASRIYFALQKAGFYGKYNTQNESLPKRVTINFFGKNSSITADTIRLNVQITGRPANDEKVFNVQVEGIAASEGADYILPDKGMKFPKDTTNAIYRIIVFRTDRIRTSPSLIKVSLEASDDFKLGPQADTTSFTGNESVVSITSLSFISKDIAFKPANWDTKLKTYFGEYTEVRFRFVIDVLGMTSFADSLPAGTLVQYRTRLRTALTAYNNTHPGAPLTDENGKVITF